ncbi:MAG: hypothetical protein KIS70_05440 [Xanthobacteraceae bacterium]|nr:hypothetical protein [Xanthobacteraceae bacterium]
MNCATTRKAHHRRIFCPSFRLFRIRHKLEPALARLLGEVLFMIIKHIAAAIFAALCLFVFSPADARERNFDKVGQWRIGAVDEKGRFHRCFAQNDSKSGMLRIAHFPNGNYNFSTPCFGRGDIDGDIEVFMSGEKGRIRMKAVRQGSSCRTVAGDLNEGWIATLRDEGNLTLVFGKDKPSWSLKGFKAAMAALKSCVAQNK